MSVITALTAQNTTGVSAIHPVPPEFVEQQMEAVISDIGVDSVKIGMLFSPELIETVALTLIKYNIGNIVVDPVMVATSGDKLLQEDAIDAIKEFLFPIADIITPNIPEASVLLDREIKSNSDISLAAKDLAEFKSKNILVKGGHLQKDTSDDFLYLAGEERIVELKSNRIETVNTHGTGCTLSSAIASYIARGENIETSVKKAKKYINSALKAAASYKIGNGHGPVHHFHKFW